LETLGPTESEKQYWISWPRKFMFRHQSHCLWCSEAEILPDFGKKQWPFWMSKMAS